MDDVIEDFPLEAEFPLILATQDSWTTVPGANPVDSANKHGVTRAVPWNARGKTFRYPPCPWL